MRYRELNAHVPTYYRSPRSARHRSGKLAAQRGAFYVTLLRFRPFPPPPPPPPLRFLLLPLLGVYLVVEVVVERGLYIVVEAQCAANLLQTGMTVRRKLPPAVLTFSKILIWSRERPALWNISVLFTGNKEHLALLSFWNRKHPAQQSISQHRTQLAPRPFLPRLPLIFYTPIRIANSMRPSWTRITRKATWI